jgi:hypothetical protein
MGVGNQPLAKDGGTGLWTPTELELIFRILPAIDLRPWYIAIPFHHLGLSADDGMACRTYVNASCHVCEQVEGWTLSPDPVDQARALLMRRTYRCLLHIIDLKVLDRGIQVWSASERMLERLLAYRSDLEYGDFTDPEHGRNVRMVRRWAEEGRGYAEPQLCPHQSRIANPNWREELRYLELFYEVPSYEAQQQRVQVVMEGNLRTR